MTDNVVADDAPKVLQLRLVVTAEDLDAALAFYRDTLGLTERLAADGPDGARVVILDAGQATLELINSAQRRYIDDVEVGRQVSRQVRVAFEVEDSAATTEVLTEAGAELLAAPVETPWRTLNSRLEAPAGLQITIFQELDPPEAVPG
ncbi:MAG TPA: VOC family protein [Acidimicrobiia bacterium]|nr:VOC family protein [Acidimicrobiia bacterium]